MKLFSKPFVWFLSALLVLSIWLGPAKASTSLTDSRINQLEFQLRSLQNQVSQLQSQLPRSGSSSTRPSPGAASPAFEPSLDEQFDNLATLVIELSQRVLALESQAAETSP